MIKDAIDRDLFAGSPETPAILQSLFVNLLSSCKQPTSTCMMFEILCASGCDRHCLCAIV